MIEGMEVKELQEEKVEKRAKFSLFEREEEAVRKVVQLYFLFSYSSLILFYFSLRCLLYPERVVFLEASFHSYLSNFPSLVNDLHPGN